jgi:hypothetical protein
VNKYLSEKRWTEKQLIDNWWVSYKEKGWYSGPHLFIFPTGIYVATSLTIRGTHSPTFNKNMFGVEMIGDYEHEELPDEIKNLTASAISVLYSFMGLLPTEVNLRFHFEDPRTTHPCPGKNVRDKGMWLNLIKSQKEN